MNPASSKTLLLCGAPQSSGSSLVSWCFLQRADADGILDARNDLLPEMPLVKTPMGWCKITISSFRTLDVANHFTDEGWNVRPLLVARDFRSVFNSLITKPYGRNSTTAEDPPLRLRLRRFHADWKAAVERGWPIIRYESFVANAEAELKQACEQLQIPWDPGMLTWPKAFEELAAPGHGSHTFRDSRGKTLAETMRSEYSAPSVKNIPADDLCWLEDEFADYNAALNYPAHMDPATCPPGRAVPHLDHSKRAQHERKPLVRFRNAVRRAWKQVIG